MKRLVMNNELADAVEAIDELQERLGAETAPGSKWFSDASKAKPSQTKFNREMSPFLEEIRGMCDEVDLEHDQLMEFARSMATAAGQFTDGRNVPKDCREDEAFMALLKNKAYHHAPFEERYNSDSFTANCMQRFLDNKKPVEPKTKVSRKQKRSD